MSAALRPRGFEAPRLDNLTLTGRSEILKSDFYHLADVMLDYAA